MKTLLAAFILSFSLVSHGQSLVWESNVSISPTWNVGNSGVYPDGKGGGLIVLYINNVGFHRAVWFDSHGSVLVTNDAENIHPLRVTSKVIDLGIPTGTRRFRVGNPNPTETTLRLSDGTYEAEQSATQNLPSADKRGYFTTQLSQTNLVVRRYSF
jgi:hypothetical protein